MIFLPWPKLTVWRLIERLEDDQLDVQLQFEGYERERQRKEVKRRAEPIKTTEPQPQPDQLMDPKRSRRKSVGTEQMKRVRLELTEPQPDQQQQQMDEKPLKLLDQSSLDILDED